MCRGSRRGRHTECARYFGHSPASSRWPFACIDSDPRRVALLQYTSGSTGEPRGVTLTHANLMHNFAVLFDLLHVPGAVGVCLVPGGVRSE